MKNSMRVLDFDNIFVYTEYSFGIKAIKASKDFFANLKREGVVTEGSFDDDIWVTYAGIRKRELNFFFDRERYQNNIGKKYGISYETMKLMLRCYTLYCVGEYIFDTIAKGIVNTIKKFLCEYDDENFKLTKLDAYRVGCFLAFIDTPKDQIEHTLFAIRIVKDEHYSVRELAPLINYMVIENEINDMFNGELSDDEFIKFFPIYFWVNITFILPLRPTEMLVTPFDCVKIDNKTIILKVRRTKLKGKNNMVRYDIDKDYKICEYHFENIRDKKVFEVIQRYQEMTKNHKRRFLFDFDSCCINNMLSLGAFNYRLSMFVQEKIIKNGKYEYAKYISGIKNFEYVTAGDSRHIALANIWFQDVGIYMAMQLADQEKVTTTLGYCTNVSQTLESSSIMFMQKKINEGILDDIVKSNALVVVDEFGCSNPKRLQDKRYTADCKKQYKGLNCFGCTHYFPGDEEIKEEKNQRKKELEGYVKQMQSILLQVNKIKNRNVDVEHLNLMIHTASARYSECVNIFAEKEALKWAGIKNSLTINY